MKNILIVESNPLVAADIEQRLQTLGYTVCAIVATGAETIEKVAEMRPNIVLISTDLEEPLKGIEIAQEIYNRFTIPVVYLIDSINEDLFEKVKMTGDFGYVFKPYETNQLRLIIESQLYQHDEDEQIRDNEQWQSDILNKVGDAVIATDEGGFVTFMNPVAEILTGWQLEEACGVYITHVFNVSVGESNRSIRTILMNVLHRGITLHWGLSAAGDDACLNAKSGLKIAVDYNAAPLRDKKRNITGIAVTFRDMRKHKEIENRLEQTITELQNQTQLMDTVFNSISDGITVINPMGETLLANPSAERIFGMPPQGVPPDEWAETYGIFYPDQETYIPADQMPIIQALHGQILEEGEFFIRNKEQPDGIYAKGRAVPLFDSNQEIRGSIAIIRDITQDKIAAAQLEQTVTELQNQVQLTDTIFNSISDGVVVTDQEGNFLLVNPSAERIVGMGATETIPDEWAETYGTFYPDQVTPFPSDQLPLVHAMQGKITDAVDVFIRNQENPDGSFISVYGRPLRDHENEVKGGVIVFRDVTKIKHAEARLEQTIDEMEKQAQLMDTIFDNMSDGVVVADDKGQYIMANPAAEKMIGQDFEDLNLPQASEQYGLFEPTTDASFPADQLPLALAIKGEVTNNVEMRVNSEQLSQEVYVSINGRPLLDKQGTLRGGVVVAHDITALKETEHRLEQTITKLENQNQLMDTVFNSISDGVVVTDEKGNFLLVNPEAEQIIGMGATETPPDKWAEKYGIFQLDKTTPFPAELPLTRVISGEAMDDINVFIRNAERPEGVYVNVSGRPLQSSTGDVRGSVIAFRDVTELKETEVRLEETITELQDQNQLMDTVFNSISDGLTVIDDQGQFLFVNSEAEQIAGIGPTDEPPSEWSEKYGIFYPDKVTPFPVEQAFLDIVSGKVADEVALFVRNSEKPEGVYIYARGRPLQSNEGNMKGAVILTQDITKLRETEVRLEETITELQNQNQLMDTVFNSISDGVLATDTNGKYLVFSERMKQLVGVPLVRDLEIDQRPQLYGLFHPDKKTLIAGEDLPLTRAMRGEDVDDVELFVRNSELPEGIFIQASGRPLQDPDGNLMGGVVLVRDITKLKETETQLEETITELQNQTQLMEAVFNHMSDGVILADKEGQYIMGNRSAEQMIGRSLQQAVGVRNAVERYGFFLPDEKTPFPADQLAIARALRGEPADNIGMFVYDPSVMRQGIHLSISARPLYDAQGAITGSVSVSRDVTELRQAEMNLQQMVRQLEEQGALLESIFNSISDGVVVADADGDFTIFNPSAERIVGIGATETDTDEWSDTYGLFFPDRVTPFPPDELPLVRAIQGDTADEVEMFVRNPNVPDGVFISVNGRPLQDDEGNPKGGVIVFRDVTHRAIAEEALTQAFAQGRLEIVETILHNIGNAINSVTVGMNVLQDNLVANQLTHRFSALADMVQAHRADWVDYIKNDPKGQQVLPFMIALAKDFSDQNTQLVETLERVTERVTHIIDIIRTQRSASQTSMTRKDINLEESIQGAVKLQQDSIDKRGIDVHIDCQNAPNEIKIQESQFHQMLVNLLKNSIEAIDDLIQSGGLNETPRIEVKTYIDEGFLVIDVTDNGIGIVQKDLKLIFNAGYTTKQTGTGLGLHSIANFVIGSGGKIYPLSEGIGKGATMRVMLRHTTIR